MSGGRLRGPRTRGCQHGLTVVELLVTLVIGVVGFLGLMAASRSLTGGTGAAGRSQEAATVATQALEGLRALSVTEMATALTGSPTVTPPFARTAYTTVVGRNGVSYTVDISVSSVSATLWRLRADVAWTEPGQATPRTLPLELLRVTTEAL